VKSQEQLDQAKEMATQVFRLFAETR
jgi:hypothetical protein